MRQFLNSFLLPSSANTAFVWDSLNSDVDLESLLIRDRFPDARASQVTDHRTVLARLLSVTIFWEAIVESEFFDTRSRQVWCSPPFHCSQQAPSRSRVCQNVHPLSCASDQSNKLHPGLLFPLLLQCTFRGLDKSWCCPSGSLLMGSGAAKKTGLPSFFGVFFHLWQVLLEGRAWRMECIVLMEVGPSKWNFNIVQWCKINHCASRVTVDGTQVNEKTVGTQATLKSLPVTASSKKIQPLWIRETPDIFSSAITASREQQRAPTTFVKDPSMTSFAARMSIHFRSSTGMNILEGGYDGGLGCPCCSVAIGFPGAGSTCHLFVTRRFSFLCVDFFHVVVRSSGDHNPWEGSGILHGSHLNFDSKLFRRKCDHDLNHWADLCKSADSPHWLRTIRVSE